MRVAGESTGWSEFIEIDCMARDINRHLMIEVAVELKMRLD